MVGGGTGVPPPFPGRIGDMTSEPTPARRGRPRKITREAIADAGRRLTLPKVTVADVAQELGVAIRSLYKHTSGIEDIQIITAEAIFASWEAPAPEGQPLEEHLLAIASSLRRLAIENPGIAGFLLRTSSDISPALVAAMDAHQRSVAEAYRLPLVHSSILLATVAEHSLAVTDVVHAGEGRRRDLRRMANDPRFPALSATARVLKHEDAERHFLFGAHALIKGLLDSITGIPGQPDQIETRPDDDSNSTP